MSLPVSNNSGQGDGDTTLVTAMVVVTALVLIVGTILVSITLKQRYDKMFWEVGSSKNK